MLETCRLGAFFMIAMILSPTAWANDSTAGLEVGNLVLEKNDGITMVSEDLMLSISEVTVSYVFENTTAKDIETLVAFPLPTYPLNPQSDYSIDTKSSDPMKFTVNVNGQPVKTSVDRKVKEPTKEDEEGEVSLKYFWKQVFPAKKRITVSHRYVPAIGSFFLEVHPEKSLVDSFCMDNTFLSFLKKAHSPAKEFLARELEYILTTGNNWKGPIQTFKLTIRKLSPETRITLCADTIKKVNETDFVTEKKNYQPKADLKILFVEP